MSRCIHVYSFVARNHGGIPFSGVCPFFIAMQVQHSYNPINQKLNFYLTHAFRYGSQTKKNVLVKNRTRDLRTIIEPNVPAYH